MRKRASSLRNFKCTVCETKMQVPKSASRKTVEGHIKHMWCFKCKQTQAFSQLDERGIYNV